MFFRREDDFPSQNGANFLQSEHAITDRRPEKLSTSEGLIKADTAFFSDKRPFFSQSIVP